MTAPTIEPMMPEGWKRPSTTLSLWKSNAPRKPPMNEPTTPSTMVVMTPIASFPGTSARAMKPAIAPMTRMAMMPMKSVSFVE